MNEYIVVHTGVLGITLVDCISILGVTLNYSFARCNHWEKLGRGHAKPLCIISYKYM
jgi:hypothetical protein